MKAQETMIQQNEFIPYVAYEAAIARLDHANRRLWVLLIITLILFIGSNIAWVCYENSFVDEVTVTQESDAKDGGTAIVNNGGGVNYGESKTDSN